MSSNFNLLLMTTSILASTQDTRQRRVRLTSEIGWVGKLNFTKILSQQRRRVYILYIPYIPVRCYFLPDSLPASSRFRVSRHVKQTTSIPIIRIPYVASIRLRCVYVASIYVYVDRHWLVHSIHIVMSRCYIGGFCRGAITRNTMQYIGCKPINPHLVRVFSGLLQTALRLPRAETTAHHLRQQHLRRRK